MKILTYGESLSLSLGINGQWERSAFWLRDHCPCPKCLHPETKQRQVDTFSLPSDIRVTEARLEKNGIFIIWSDGHQAHFASLPETESDLMQPILWDKKTIERDFPTVPYELVIKDDRGLYEWLAKIQLFGFCFVEGVPPDAEATKRLAERVSYIRETIFGGFWDFTANMEHKDTAYTTLAIGPHTDGTYSFDAPGYQMFHCLAFNGEGGESTLVDGFNIAQILKNEDPQSYRTLSEELVTGQYIDRDRGIYLQATRPILRHDGKGRLVQVSFNNLDRAPLNLPKERAEKFYHAIRAFWRLANDATMEWRRRLNPGEVLLFDNWRTLHGRAAYSGYRRLCGAYLNKEDVESRLRVLGAP